MLEWQLGDSFVQEGRVCFAGALDGIGWLKEERRRWWECCSLHWLQMHHAVDEVAVVGGIYQCEIEEMSLSR